MNQIPRQQALQEIAQEQRRAPRLRSLIKATIVLHGRRSTYDCLIRNQSRDGLLLELTDAMSIPTQFELLVGIDKIRERCRVMWRAPGKLGVSLERPEGTPLNPEAQDGLALTVKTGNRVGTDKKSDLSKRLARKFPHLVKR